MTVLEFLFACAIGYLFAEWLEHLSWKVRK
jgi:predicted outer membrane lipoprotein